MHDLMSNGGERQGDQHGTVYVAAAPPKTFGEDLLKKVASLIGQGIYDTRLRLAGEIPRILASCPGAGAAEPIAQALRDAGLVAFVCTDSELRNCPAGLVAHTARFGEREATFWDRRGEQVRVEAVEAFLIIRGRKRTTTQEKTSTTKMKLNVTATVLTGGIPIMRRVTKKTTRESFQAEGFVRIYDRKSSDPRVEIFQNHVDYAFLGPELTPSTPANFNLAVTKLREWFPAAVFDDRMTRHFKTDVSAAGPEEALEINCKLIYLCQLALERRGCG